MNFKTKAVVLLSGGMDSLVTAAMAVQKHQTAFLHCNYGQRTEGKELDCFRKLVEFYKPDQHRIIDLPWLGEIGGSALTDNAIEVPLSHESDTIPLTYVPFRNSVFLSAAVAWAEVLGAEYVYYGAVEVDSSGYPDCREDYVYAFNEMVQKGTKNTTIRVVAPLIRMKKDEIIRLGMELKAPFHFSWSCYQQSDVACAVCDSCRLRLAAFKRAGIEDPIPYQRSS